MIEQSDSRPDVDNPILMWVLLYSAPRRRHWMSDELDVGKPAPLDPERVLRTGPPRRNPSKNDRPAQPAPKKDGS
jgi:hypothetical protein